MAKIRTTHTGSLHRPAALVDLLISQVDGEPAPGIDEVAHDAVEEIVRDQVAAGIDIVNDGEQGKHNYATYVTERLTGFELGKSPRRVYMDVAEFPDFATVIATLDPGRATRPDRHPACTGPIALRDTVPIERDIQNLTDAAAAAGLPADRLFMTAASPGTVAVFLENVYYPSKSEYLAALADAMREEYRAIIDAGFTLQIDCPDITMRQGEQFRGMTLDQTRDDIVLSIEALSAATADLPPDQMRMHLCWGNNEAPHVHDIALGDVIDLVVTARPAGIAFEASNPRHGHEWQVFEEFKLPDDKYVLPGVIDTTTNFVEHPELVAQRLRNYANLLGNERVVATTDCGFGTFAGRNRVARTVAWAKLHSMVEGAALASR